MIFRADLHPLWRIHHTWARRMIPRMFVADLPSRCAEMPRVLHDVTLHGATLIWGDAYVERRNDR
jgi:hypothetical protein